MHLGLRSAVAALHLTASLVFVVGIKRVFAKPTPAHRFTVALVAATVLSSEFGAILFSEFAPVHGAASIAAYALSLELFFSAAQVNRTRPLTLAFEPDVPKHLQQDGPYRWIRHPFYASYLLAFLAGWIASGRWWLSVPVALGFATYVRAAKFEEEKFGCSPLHDDYERYRQQVGMFLPIRTVRNLWVHRHEVSHR